MDTLEIGRDFNMKFTHDELSYVMAFSIALSRYVKLEKDEFMSPGFIAERAEEIIRHATDFAKAEVICTNGKSRERKLKETEEGYLRNRRNQVKRANERCDRAIENVKRLLNEIQVTADIEVGMYLKLVVLRKERGSFNEAPVKHEIYIPTT